MSLLLLAAEAPRAIGDGLTLVGDIGVRIAATPDVLEVAHPSAAPAYVAAERAVSNWRSEAVRDLHPLPVSALAVAMQIERPFVTRCVKLNNYWCIKRARWNGEIGYDEEGHTGFASAERGADAAVTLLRRYYLDYGRKSAMDVVRRWAPAECRTSVAGIGFAAVNLPTIAVRGLQNTLRARWLAARRGSAPRPVAKVAAAGPAPVRVARPAPARRISAVPLRPLPAFKVPDIAVGMGERKVTALNPSLQPRPLVRRQPTPASVAAATAARASPQKRAAPRVQARVAPAAPSLVRTAPSPPVRLASLSAAAPARKPAPVVACSSDETRIRNYAARIVEGLDVGPGDDLKLFEADGRPLPNLWRVLLAMSSFELGSLRASAELIDGAIARATPRIEASAPVASNDPPRVDAASSPAPDAAPPVP